MLSLLLLCALLSSPAWGFSCKDQNNQDVDWFAIYKMPKEKDNSAPGVGSGLAYYYLDAKDKTQLKASAQNLSSKTQALAYTLQQYYDQQNSDIFHVMFNDEPYVSKSKPELRSNRVLAGVQFGHTKGTIFFNGNSGVWLIHSVPKFPPPTAYGYPDSGTDYGQTMLCLTLKYTSLNSIGTQLFFNHPDIYSSKLPTSMASDNEDLAKVIAGKFQSGTPYSSIIDVATAGGQRFRTFAKSAGFNKDLYDGLVAPSLHSNLVVESWRRGDEVPLDCAASYKVNDALTIHVGNTGEFKYTKDHSKMARSPDSSTPWVCIGDVNRMTSQYVRGGGTVCVNDAAMWKAFNVISTKNNC